MRIKHWQGYGCVTAYKYNKDYSVRLHIHVFGDHEWHNMRPKIRIVPGQWFDIKTNKLVDDCHYYFTY